MKIGLLATRIAARNSNGGFLWVADLPLNHTKAFIVDAIALSLAIFLAIRLGINKVELETDAQALVTTLSSGKDANLEL